MFVNGIVKKMDTQDEAFTVGSGIKSFYTPDNETFPSKVVAHGNTKFFDLYFNAA